MKNKYIIFDSVARYPLNDTRFLFKKIKDKIRFGSNKNCIFFDSLDCILDSTNPIDEKMITQFREYAEDNKSKKKYGVMALSWISHVGLIETFEAETDEEAKLYFELKNLEDPMLESNIVF